MFFRYCTSCDQPRIQASDKDFLKLRFGGVPVILVFTKFDNLRHTAESGVLNEHLRSDRGLPRVAHALALPEPARSLVQEKGDQKLQSLRSARVDEWKKSSPIDVSTVFVSTKSRGNPHITSKALGFSKSR